MNYTNSKAFPILEHLAREINEEVSQLMMFCIPTCASLALLYSYSFVRGFCYVSYFHGFIKQPRKKILICIWQAKILN